jgi:hypothetical protein
MDQPRLQEPESPEQLRKEEKIICTNPVETYGWRAFVLHWMTLGSYRSENLVRFWPAGARMPDSVRREKR